MLDLRGQCISFLFDSRVANLKGLLLGYHVLSSGLDF